ncbi:MAG: hypothetical protein MAG551_02199 [Candidatus Scalindua arabica]|uniref:Uncharacterized protein n=1 Tax=Candidatus Scalindua arabica TaxID=1127984 RepID=A0A941W4H0_9BACT|nr:hypothetical protein [Candidatus Scalindua arabica]
MSPVVLIAWHLRSLNSIMETLPDHRADRMACSNNRTIFHAVILCRPLLLESSRYAKIYLLNLLRNLVPRKDEKRTVKELTGINIAAVNGEM